MTGRQNENRAEGIAALKRVVLQREIETDAKENGHAPGVWVLFGPGSSEMECCYCGEVASIIDGECYLDNLQDPCGGVRMSARQNDDSMRKALEQIALLALEERDYDNDPRVDGVRIALEALGWVEWECHSRFTGCRVMAVGPPADLLAAGWAVRDGRPRCPAHATTVDPTTWTEETRPR